MTLYLVPSLYRRRHFVWYIVLCAVVICMIAIQSTRSSQPTVLTADYSQGHTF